MASTSIAHRNLRDVSPCERALLQRNNVFSIHERADLVFDRHAPMLW